VQPTEDKRGPELKFPPPLLVLAVVAAAYLLETMQSLPISTGGAPWRSGIVLIMAGFVLALISLFHFIAAKTHVEPWRPTTVIIESGVFRVSRNPIYLAFCIATIGCGLVLNSWWVVVAVAPLVYLLQQLAIKREEAYLQQKFGRPYLDYKRRVRRWL